MSRIKIDQSINETPKQYYYRIYNAKINHEEWAKNIPCDSSIAYADNVSDQSLAGVSLICHTCLKNFAEPYECKPCHFNRIFKTTQSNIWLCSCKICCDYGLTGISIDQAERHIREKRIAELKLDSINPKNKIKIEKHQKRINELVKEI